MMFGSDRSRAPCRETAGFTLIELLVVLAIIATAAALVLPGALRRPEPRLELITADQVARLRKLHVEAVARGRALAVTLTDRAGLVAIDANGTTTVLPPGTSARLVGARGQGAGPRIVFFPDGSATGGRLTLMRGGEQRDIDVNWATGMVTVEPVR